jgi:hypothetical protein
MGESSEERVAREELSCRGTHRQGVIKNVAAATFFDNAERERRGEEGGVGASSEELSFQARTGRPGVSSLATCYLLLATPRLRSGALSDEPIIDLQSDDYFMGQALREAR